MYLLILIVASVVCTAAFLYLNWMISQSNVSAYQKPMEWMKLNGSDGGWNDDLSGRPVRPTGIPPTLSASAAAIPEPEPRSVTLRGRALPVIDSLVERN